MHCSRQRAVAVFLLVLAMAMPVAALPEEGLDPDRSPGPFAALWNRLSSLLGLSESAGARSPGEAVDGILSLLPWDADSRSSMDPNGGS